MMPHLKIKDATEYNEFTTATQTPDKAFERNDKYPQETRNGENITEKVKEFIQVLSEGIFF